VKPHFSPSQFGTAASCLRKWYFENVLGLRQADTEATLRGTRIHALLERYVKDPAHPLPNQQATVTYARRLPFTRVRADGTTYDEEEVTEDVNPKEAARAMSALVLLPNPTEVPMVAEGEFLLTAEETGLGKPVKGFIDLWLPTMRAVRDYKSKSTSRYDKTVEELRNDPQCLLYAKRHLRDHDEVSFSHLNIYMDGTRAELVEVTGLTADVVDDGIAQLRPLAQRMLAAEQLEKWSDVPVRLAACTAYGGCPHRGNCASTGLAVFGDSVQTRTVRAMAEAEGRYKSPEELEMGFSDFVKTNDSSKVSLNPADGVPATQRGEAAVHADAVAEASAGASEQVEETFPDAPNNKVDVPDTPAARKSPKDTLVDSILHAAGLLPNESAVAAFTALVDGVSDAAALRKQLLSKTLPVLKDLLAQVQSLTSGTPAQTTAPAAAPAASAGPAVSSVNDWAAAVNASLQKQPKTLAELAALESDVSSLLAQYTAVGEAFDKQSAALKKKRDDAEDTGDEAASEEAGAKLRDLLKRKKGASEMHADLQTQRSNAWFAAARKALTPAPAPAAEKAPVQQTQAAPTVNQQPVDGKRLPILLINCQFLGEARVLHIESLLTKYQLAVAAAASVASYHEIKFEGPARVAALLSHDLSSGNLDISQYDIVSVPRRSGQFDPIIDELRKYVSAAFSGNM
jgi:hypothetical protein